MTAKAQLMSALRIVLIALLVIQLIGCKAAVNKLAFHPDNADLPSADQLSEGVEEILIETEDGLELTSLYLPSSKSDGLVVYFHGNGGNLYRRLPSLLKLQELGLSVLGLSYRGYGKSEGAPSESGIYLDGEAALAVATEDLGFSKDRIILLGRSIGSTVAVELAQNKDLLGVILVTPLTNGRAMAKEIGMGWLSPLAGDAFDNLSKIESLVAPLLIIHGTEDGITPFFMGEELFDRAPDEKFFVPIQGGRHNDLHIEFEHEYWGAISEFMVELGY